MMFMCVCVVFVHTTEDMVFLRRVNSEQHAVLQDVRRRLMADNVDYELAANSSIARSPINATGAPNRFLVVTNAQHLTSADRIRKKKPAIRIRIDNFYPIRILGKDDRSDVKGRKRMYAEYKSKVRLRRRNTEDLGVDGRNIGKF